MSGGRLPKRIVFGNLEGAVRRGRGGKEKEWTDCVWHSGEMESDGHGGWAEVHGHVEERRGSRG